MFVVLSKKPGCNENEFFLKTRYFQLTNLGQQLKHLPKLLLKRLDLLITLQLLVHPAFLLSCNCPSCRVFSLKRNIPTALYFHAFISRAPPDPYYFTFLPPTHAD